MLSSQYFPLAQGTREFQEQFRRVVGAVKALRGEVYGEGLRDALLIDARPDLAARAACVAKGGDALALPRLRARLPDPAAIASLVAVLRLDHGVEQVDPRKTPGVYLVRLPPPCAPGVLLLEATFGPRGLWRLERPFFDVDALASTGSALYVYPLATALDVLSVLRRIGARRFAALQAICTPQYLALAIQSAVTLVRAGWTMDDAVLGARSWLAAPWKAPGAETPSVECSICQEPFEGADVLVRLPCRHAFHGHRARGACPGVAAWLAERGTCPCCRACAASA